MSPIATTLNFKPYLFLLCLLCFLSNTTQNYFVNNAETKRANINRRDGPTSQSLTGESGQSSNLNQQTGLQQSGSQDIAFKDIIKFADIDPKPEGLSPDSIFKITKINDNMIYETITSSGKLLKYKPAQFINGRIKLQPADEHDTSTQHSIIYPYMPNLLSNGNAFGYGLTPSISHTMLNAGYSMDQISSHNIQAYQNAIRKATKETRINAMNVITSLITNVIQSLELQIEASLIQEAYRLPSNAVNPSPPQSIPYPQVPYAIHPGFYPVHPQVPYQYGSTPFQVSRPLIRRNDRPKEMPSQESQLSVGDDTKANSEIAGTKNF